MIKASKKNDVALARIPYIYYSLCFHKNKKSKVQALTNFGSKINTMIPAYVLKLGFKVYRTNIKALKIDASIFKTF